MDKKDCILLENLDGDWHDSELFFLFFGGWVGVGGLHMDIGFPFQFFISLAVLTRG